MNRIFTVALSVFLIFSIHLIADPQKPLSEMTLEELMRIDVISSTQTAIRVQEAPSTIFVVTADQIRRWGIRRLSELIDRLIPGTYVTEDGDDLILGFRGISSDINTKVLLQLNGHYYNTQWNNGLNTETELGLLQDIKRVEVINGPGGALYGAGATIGVINMITYSGEDYQGVEASANIGTGEYKRAEIMGGDVIERKELDYFFSAGGLSSEGYTNNNNEPLNISRYPPGWRFFTDVGYKDFRLTSRFTRSCRDFYGLRASTTDPNRYAVYDSFFVDAQKEFKLNQNLNLVAALTLDMVQTQRYDFTRGTKLRGVGEDRYGLKVTGFYSGWDKNQLVFGAEYRRDEFGNDWYGDNFNFLTKVVDGVVTGIPVDPYTRRAITPYGRNVYAVFAQDSIAISDRYNLLLGIRYDRIEAPQIEQPDAVTPRIALVVTPNDHSVLKAMFSSGFRQPTAGLTSPDEFVLGGATLTEITNPEKVYSLEFSGSYDFGTSANFTLNFFYNWFRNVHGLDPTLTPQGQFVNISVGGVDYVGFEAIVDLSLKGNVFARGAYQHVQLGSEVNDVFGTLVTPEGEHILSYPGDVVKLLVEVPVTKWMSVNSNTNFVWNFWGRLPNGPAVDTGFFANINANVVFDLSNHVQVMLSGYNLTNEDTKIPQTLNSFTFQAERNFNLTFSYMF